MVDNNSVKTKLPNFLIVGAAKSGTTSLYYYLKQHPEIYMSAIKEPKFFSAQFVKYNPKVIKENLVITKYEDYKNLFENVDRENAIGEASADYLYFYDGCIKLIKKYLGDVKIIIILRNPVEMTFSMYQMFIRQGKEHLSFEDALNAEQERKRLNWGYGGGWYYKDLGFYYIQVKSYLENFTHVKVYLFDDLKSNPLSLIKDMYQFLDVDDTFVPDTDIKYNPGGVPNNKLVYTLLTIFKRFKKPIIQICKFFSLEKKFFEITENIRKIILRKQEMKLETRAYLRDQYREDISRLQDLINRDLSHWLK